MWVFFENHSYEDLIGPPGSARRARAPYLNRLADRCGLATRSYALAHPSLPNYLASVSGTTGGVRTSCTPKTCPQTARTVFRQLRSAHRAWRVYAESMPHNCARSDSGRYAVRHTAAPYFPAIAEDCARWQVPLGTPTRGRLVDDLAHNRIPSLSLIVPNLCNQTHDCPIATGDRWLAQLMPRILASPDYRQGRTAVFVTYDEGAGGTRGQDCRRTSDRSCHIATVAVSPTTRPGTRSATRFDHYSLLETTERLFGLSPLGHAADARTVTFRGAFGL